MSARLYLMLDTIDGKAETVAETLRLLPGVVRADCLEGSPEVMALVEADDRVKLAERLMNLLGKVDEAVNDIHMMVTRDSILAVHALTNDELPHQTLAA